MKVFCVLVVGSLKHSQCPGFFLCAQLSLYILEKLSMIIAIMSLHVIFFQFNLVLLTIGGLLMLLLFDTEQDMARLEPANTDLTLCQVNNGSRKPRILLVASGSVAAIKFANLCHCFSEWADVKAVATKASLHFIDRVSLPKGVVLYTDEDEWSCWNQVGDTVLHIELQKWADIMVIAPLSANTLGKIAGGLCDNLLTCIVRAWDYSKPMFVAPAMNTLMWNNPFTERHLMVIDDLGISLIPPVTKRLACGDYGNGAMAEPSLIYSTVRLFYENREQSSTGNV